MLECKLGILYMSYVLTFETHGQEVSGPRHGLTLFDWCKYIMMQSQYCLIPCLTFMAKYLVDSPGHGSFGRVARRHVGQHWISGMSTFSFVPVDIILY